jgi:CrcB protein
VQLILIALGGAIGSVCRYGLSTAVQRSTSPFFPYGTFAVNVLGCLVFGIIIGAARQRFVLGPSERAFLLIGVLGGFTTFSTFSYETFALLQDGELVRAAANALGQLFCGVVALWAGYALVAALGR